MYIWLLLAVLGSVLTESPETPGVEITCIEGENGMLSTKHADLRIYHTVWKMATHVHLTEFLNKRQTFMAQWFGMNRICKEIGTSCTFKAQLTQAMKRIEGLGETNQHMQDLLLDENEREKRAVLGFVGKINKILFGTMDEDDAEYYDECIQKLQNTSSETLALLANQTHIIKSEFQSIRSNLKNINDTIMIVEAQIRSVANKLAQEIDKIKQIERMESILAIFDTELSEYEVDTQILINAILFAKRGQLHPSIMSPQNIIKAGAEVIRNNRGIEFPTPLENSYITELLKLSDLTAYLHKKKVVFVLTIPLVELTRYAVYKHTILPMKLSNNTTPMVVFITPTHPYTAISEQVNTFFKLGNDDVDRCKRGSKELLCKNTRPIYEVNNNKDCEVQMITNPKFKGSEICDVRVKPMTQTYWTQIDNSNSWVFSVVTEDELRVSCTRREPTTVSISGIGKITLSTECEARSREVTLIPFSEITSKIETGFPSRAMVDIPKLINETLRKAGETNLTEIFDDEIFSQTIQAGPNDEDSMRKDSLGLQVIINKAKALSKQKLADRRLKRVENGLGLAGITVGTLGIFGAIMWKFSVWSRIAMLCRGIKRVSGTRNRARTPHRRSTRTPSPEKDPHRVETTLVRETRPVSTATITEIIEPEGPLGAVNRAYSTDTLASMGELQLVPHNQAARFQQHQGRIPKPYRARAIPQGWEMIEPYWGEQMVAPRYPTRRDMGGW